VFLNIPFDAKYRQCYLALIAGLAAHGLLPRSVLEVPASNDRLRRILRLMRQCRYSIHDLSRVERSGGVPRFNMPFEAGLATALWLLEGRHQRFLLEAKRFRLERSLSDLNGTDPYIHGGTPEGVLRATSGLFARPGLKLTIADLRRVYERLRLYAKRETRRGQWDGLYSPDAFGRLVAAAMAIAVQMGLSRRGRKRRRHG
jgi:hypothetical protein